MSFVSSLHFYLWARENFITQCLLQPDALLAFTSLYTLPDADGWTLKERSWRNGVLLSCQDIATGLTQLKAFDLFHSKRVSFRDRAHNEALQLGVRFTSSARSPFAWEMLSRGTLVSTLHPIEAYSSGRGEMPFCFFEPGDVGKIAEVDVPSVRHNPDNPRDVFACVDFEKSGVFSRQGTQQSTWRCPLYYHHAVQLSSLLTRV